MTIRRCLYLITIFFNTLLISTLIAQNTITGKIFDKNTNQPVPFVNVFLSNTTIGSTTNMEGSFVIEKIPDGIYQLVIQCIGYEIITKQIKLISNSRVIIEKFYLIPTVIDMDFEVTVEALKPREWKRIYKQFKEQFLGTTKYATDCTILNPEVLNFKQDSVIKGYCATSDSILLVENRYLGYQISMFIKHFKWSSIDFDPTGNLRELEPFGVVSENTETESYYSHEVYPMFKEMEPVKKGDRKGWEKRRIELYNGSLKHFLYIIANGSDDENYTLTSFAIDTLDSISHRTVLDQNSKKEISFEDLDVVENNGLKRLSLTNYLKVSYFHGTSDISYLKLKNDYLDIDMLGNCYYHAPIVISGYWSRLRLAGILPDDYRLE